MKPMTVIVEELSGWHCILYMPWLKRQIKENAFARARAIKLVRNLRRGDWSMAQIHPEVCRSPEICRQIRWGTSVSVYSFSFWEAVIRVLCAISLICLHSTVYETENVISLVSKLCLHLVKCPKLYQDWFYRHKKEFLSWNKALELLN